MPDTRFAAALVTLAVAAGLAATTAASPAPAAAAAPPPELARMARSLPPLPRTAGGVELPLAAEQTRQPFAWTPIRPGVTVAAGDQGLAVGFTVVTGAPAGAALVVPPGTLAGIDSLRLRARADRNAQLVVSLMEAGGAAFALPSVPLRAGGGREHRLDLADARYLEGQSTVPEPDRFDPAQVVMITLLDLSGFMGSATPRVEWVIEGLEGLAP